MHHISITWSNVHVRLKNIHARKTLADDVIIGERNGRAARRREARDGHTQHRFVRVVVKIFDKIDSVRERPGGVYDGASRDLIRRIAVSDDHRHAVVRQADLRKAQSVRCGNV